ncbi:MAG: hypothetical protein ABJA62_11075 [Luteimonas sp.]
MLKPFSLTSSLVLAIVSLPAMAVTVQRVDVPMSTENCQAALPAFDGLIRHRPLAVQNEGTSNAFITCGFIGSNGATPQNYAIEVLLRNDGSAAATVSCTLIDGRSNLNDPIFLVKSVSVAAGSVAFPIVWTANLDNGGILFHFPAVSCSIPPHVGIQATARFYNEDVGA